MLRSILLATIFLTFAPPALAVPGLDGTWRFRKYECSSGAFAKLYDNLDSGPDNTEDMTIDGTHVRYTKKIQSEFSPKETERLFERWMWDLEAAKRLPAGPEREARIARAMKDLDGARRIASGVVCTYVDEATFKVNGDILEFSDRKLLNDDCPDGSPFMKGNGPFGPEVSHFEVSGDSLRLHQPTKSTYSSGEDGVPCPSDDFLVKLYKRRK